MDKVSASKLQNHGFEPHTGQDHDSSYDTSTDCMVHGSGLQGDLNKLYKLTSQSS